MDDRVSSPIPCTVYKSSLTPEEIALYRSGSFVELLPTARINQLLDRPNLYGKTVSDLCEAYLADHAAADECDFASSGHPEGVLTCEPGTLKDRGDQDIAADRTVAGERFFLASSICRNHPVVALGRWPNGDQHLGHADGLDADLHFRADSAVYLLDLV